jgi:inorganic pyrophosphatase
MAPMPNLTSYPNQLNSKKIECRAIIETPKNRRNKFDYDPESGLFALGGVLPEGMIFPHDFGFIPSTLGDDGDPLDVLVLLDEPAHVGCLLQVRIIGVIEAEQTENGKTDVNNRLLAVSIHSHSHENTTSIKNVAPSVLKQLEEFFVSYNRLHGKKFKVTNLGGPKRALALIQKGIKTFDEKKSA